MLPCILARKWILTRLERPCHLINVRYDYLRAVGLPAAENIDAALNESKRSPGGISLTSAFLEMSVVSEVLSFGLCVHPLNQTEI